MSCSEDNEKSMQFVVTEIIVVASITFCQFPMSPIRLKHEGYLEHTKQENDFMLLFSESGAKRSVPLLSWSSTGSTNV